MPLEVDKCVQKLMNQGKKQSDSWAICYSQYNKKNKKRRKKKRK